MLDVTVNENEHVLNREALCFCLPNSVDSGWREQNPDLPQHQQIEVYSNRHGSRNLIKLSELWSFEKMSAVVFSNEQVAIITGASSGIGAGTAIKLVQKGITKLCLSGRPLDDLQQTKKTCLKQSLQKISDEDIILDDGESQ